MNHETAHAIIAHLAIDHQRKQQEHDVYESRGNVLEARKSKAAAADAARKLREAIEAVTE